MSSESDTGSADAITAFYDALFVGLCCTVAATTFIVYSWVTSLAREVKLFWKGPPTGARVLYFLCRYTTLFTTIFSSLLLFDFSDETCTTLNRTFIAISVLAYLVWATFSALRVYALMKHYALSILIFLLATVPFAAGLTLLIWDVVDEDIAPMGCVGSIMNTSTAAYNKLVIATCTCVITADVLVVLSTWWAMPGRSGGLLRRETFWSSGTGLFSVIFRDGMIYFLVLSLLSSLDMGLSLSDANGFIESSIPTFIDPLASILVSTFLLDLQEAHQGMCRMNTSDPLYSEGNSSLVFARVVGALAASIEPGIIPIDDFDDEDSDTVSDQREDYVSADEQDLVVTDEQDRIEV